MTSDYIRILIDYHFWARDRTLASLEQLTPEQLTRGLGSSFGSVLDTAVHLYFAEWIWYHRWRGESPTVRPDTSALTTVAALREAWLPMETQIRTLIDDLGPTGLTRVVEYSLLNGQPASSPFWQMIVHVVNHGSYHRGQIATMLRQVGAKPAASTDMILFFREQSVPAQ